MKTTIEMFEDHERLLEDLHDLIRTLAVPIMGKGEVSKNVLNFKHPTVYYVEDHKGTKNGSLSFRKVEKWKEHTKEKGAIQSCGMNEFNESDCHLLSDQWNG